MKIKIQSPAHPELRALERSTQTKMKQLSSDHASITEADIRFHHGLNDQGDKSCEIYLKLKDRNIFVKQQGQTFELSMKKAVDKLNNQIKNISNPL